MLETSPNQITPIIGGRYRVIGSLGTGAMGTVYAAVEDAFRRTVAVKVIKPDVVDERARARFRVEALATSQLAHPNVVAVHDFGVDGDEFFLVLEHLTGVNLQDELDRVGSMSWTRAVSILAQIAAAVAAAHDEQIVHRDLKPKNIFLCNGPGITDFVKVLDFGIAKMLGEGAPRVSTTTGVVLGTPGFVAPERIAGSPNDDPQSDVYAIGCIAWQLLTGAGPFSASSNVLLLVRHLRERAPRLEDRVTIPDALARIIASTLEKSPAQRPTARQLVCQLRALSPDPV